MARRGHCDLVADLAVPLPAQVFLTLFGLPVQDRDRLNTWKEGLVRTKPGEPGETRGEHAIRMGTELFEYLVEQVAQRREAGTSTGLLGQLLTDPSDDRLTDEEIYGLTFLFVLAGLETVTSALSTAFAVLASQPALRRRIAADPAVIPAAVEELLRVDGPLVFVPRVTTQDVEVAGQLVPGRHAGTGHGGGSRPGPGRAPGSGRDRLRPPVRSGTWPSAAGRTAASGRTWPGWKCGWRSRSGTGGYRTTNWPPGPRRG